MLRGNHGRQPAFHSMRMWEIIEIVRSSDVWQTHETLSLPTCEHKDEDVRPPVGFFSALVSLIFPSNATSHVVLVVCNSRRRSQGLPCFPSTLTSSDSFRHQLPDYPLDHRQRS
eukprot:768032-Hanusia_phi.AAC.1